MTKEMELFIDGHHGVYCPQAFAERIKRECVENVSDEDWKILEEGPDSEHYWEVWTEVTDNAVITNPETGEKYTVFQDGDVWLVPEGFEWPEDY